MTRGTTPTVSFELPFPLSNVDSLSLTFKQGSTMVVKSLEDIEVINDACHIKLSQEETLAFNSNSVAEVQLRVKLLTGDTLASEVYSVEVERILKDGVM